MIYCNMAKYDHVMNKETGKSYTICTGNLQSRNRYAVRDYKGNRDRIAESKLIPITKFEVMISRGGEQIIANKKAMTEVQATIVALYRNLKTRVQEEA